MSTKWSLSAHRMFRRCQRQYFFAHIAASHNAKDPLRHEAFILKQLKHLSTWQGLVVHEGIERFVIPCLERHSVIDWDSVIAQTEALARKQFAFSKARRFREKGLTKSSCNGEYCALMDHEKGRYILPESLEQICETIRRCFGNLAHQQELINHLEGRSRYWAEHPIPCMYGDVRIEVRPDLFFFRDAHCPTIVDWKVEQDATSADHRLQTGLYGWVLCHSDRWQVRRAEEIELIEVQLREGRVVRHRCSSALFEEVEDVLYRSSQEIRLLCGEHRYEDQVLEDFEYAQSPNTCSFCVFNSLCRSYGNGSPRFESVRGHQSLATQLLLPSLEG